jgi:hypothetical protein
MTNREIDALDDLEAKAKAATPGPWYSDGDHCSVADGNGDYVCNLDFDQGDDADFIAAANPQTVLALIDVVRAADDLMDDIAMLGDKVPKNTGQTVEIALKNLKTTMG